LNAGRVDCAQRIWENFSMALTADSKKRVGLPSAGPGDVRRTVAQRKRTKAEVLAAIRNWKSLSKIRWEDLRKMTREL